MSEKLRDLLARKNQRFICSAAGSFASEDSCNFTALITHEVTDPLTVGQLKELEDSIGYHSQLFTLFSNYGSVRLYCDTLSDNSAFYLANPSEWNDLFSEFNLWIEELDDKEKKELLPKWIDSAIVIGEIPNSGNYYLFPIRGIEEGKIFEFEHDGFEFIEVAKDLEAFIESICTVTDSLLSNIRSHTRYSDGKTDIQWLVKNYRYDGS